MDQIFSFVIFVPFVVQIEPPPTQRSCEKSPRHPPPCKHPGHASDAAENESSHRPEPVSQLPANEAADIDSHEDAEFHNPAM